MTKDTNEITRSALYLDLFNDIDTDGTLQTKIYYKHGFARARSQFGRIHSKQIKK